MADLRIDIASEFTGAKAFKKADKATAGLEKGVKRLGATLAATFTTRALVNFAKAFAQDDKAAQLLTRSLNNLGLAFADPQVRAFISELETTSGVVDEKLRPAFQRLLTTTGSVEESQRLLRTALDLSAASGADVVSVSSDLSKAYVGQTRGLAKYGLGLTQAELKAMTFEEIQAKITKLFAGQAQVAADSYAGSIDKIAVAGDNAKEIIGKGLVEALGSAGGTSGLAGSLSGIIKLATIVSDLFVGIGRTVAALGAFFGDGLSPKQAFAEYQKVTAAFRLEDQIARRQYGGAAATKYQKEAAALAKKNLVVVTKQTKIIKEQTALQKAGTLFDIQGAGIIAALKGKISDEERTRLQLQLALLTGNEAAASKLAGEVARSQGLTESLVKYYQGLPSAKNPFSGWLTTLKEAQELASLIAAGDYKKVPLSMAGGNDSGVFSPVVQEMITSSNVSARAGASGNVTVYVQGSVISEADLVEAVSNGLLNRSLSGSPSAIGRLKGSFAG